MGLECKDDTDSNGLFLRTAWPATPLLIMSSMALASLDRGKGANGIEKYSEIQKSFLKSNDAFEPDIV